MQIISDQVRAEALCSNGDPSILLKLLKFFI